MKKQIILYSIFIVCVMSLVLPLTAQALPIKTTADEAYSVKILEAYYIEDDIYSKMEIKAQTQSTAENFYLKLTLINPIGEELSYLLKVMTHLEYLILDIVFYNSATVAGDYTILATIISNNRWYAETDMVVFDPPNGGSEGDPYIGISLG
ncbi:hypothetical protein EU534_02495 [Candidatus Heimdallarchaeota archaeon]|nr:MAG: hypothetical protein EU534_02495 [Candidatus Heimdallarchaeota archaeon]